jgi:mannose-binding lectin 2
MKTYSSTPQGTFFAVLCFVSVFISSNIPTLHAQTGNWNTNDYFKREHSLTKPYQGSGWQIPYWDFYGSTIVTNQYIRLTPDVRSQQGGLWNSVPVRVRNWEVHLQFAVHGKGKDLFGDGLVLWYAKDRMSPGTVFGSKDRFLGLAIIVDTYSNHNGPHNHGHPYISAMVNNGSLLYDHDRDGTLTQLAGCEAKVRNLQHDSYISVRYENDVLTVSTDIQGKNAWAQCFQVKGVVLPTGYFFGLSAATGDLSDNHDIISLKTYELEAPNAQAAMDRDEILPTAQFFEPLREHVEDPKPAGTSGLKIFFYTLVGILAAVAIVVVGVIVYQNHQQNSRKRFY